MNKKALSPVVASIILIAVIVAVSIAVAAWMGATFTFTRREEPYKPQYTIVIPPYGDADSVKAWIEVRALFLPLIARTEGIVPLPANLTFVTEANEAYLKIEYYKSEIIVQENVTLFQRKMIGYQEYTVKLGETNP